MIESLSNSTQHYPTFNKATNSLLVVTYDLKGCKRSSGGKREPVEAIEQSEVAGGQNFRFKRMISSLECKPEVFGTAVGQLSQKRLPRFRRCQNF